MIALVCRQEGPPPKTVYCSTVHPFVCWHLWVYTCVVRVCVCVWGGGGGGGELKSALITCVVPTSMRSNVNCALHTCNIVNY